MKIFWERVYIDFILCESERVMLDSFECLFLKKGWIRVGKILKREECCRRRKIRERDGWYFRVFYCLVYICIKVILLRIIFLKLIYFYSVQVFRSNFWYKQLFFLRFNVFFYQNCVKIQFVKQMLVCYLGQFDLFYIFQRRGGEDGFFFIWVYCNYKDQYIFLITVRVMF